MKGTDKQIAFAENLVNKFDTEMSGLIEICPDHLKAQWIELKSKLDGVFAEAYAGDVIDVLKGNNEAGQKYYTRFFYSVKLNAAPLARKIMKEAFGK